MPRDPPRAQAFFEDFPLVLWVRDPVSRFLSCWDAWLFVDGNATVLERRQARWQAAVLRVTGEHVEAADLNRVLLTLREKKNFSLTRRVLATIEHADLDLAWCRAAPPQPSHLLRPRPRERGHG